MKEAALRALSLQDIPANKGSVRWIDIANQIVELLQNDEVVRYTTGLKAEKRNVLSAQKMQSSIMGALKKIDNDTQVHSSLRPEDNLFYIFFSRTQFDGRSELMKVL